MTKVLVIGGYTDVSETYLDNVEAVDLSSETPDCDSVSNYPFPVGFATGTVLEGFPTVCGGYNSDSSLYTNECYQFLYGENRWVLMDYAMSEAKNSHKSSMVDSATWLISGGRILVEAVVLTSLSEVWHDGQFKPGPILPYPLECHCQVTLNSSYVAILGGRTSNGTDYEYPTNFYLLDWKNEEWIAMPDVPAVICNDPCGIIENSVNGVELVVLSDSDGYIFNFEEMVWRDGPTLDLDLFYDEMPVQMEKTFYIMGGYLGDNAVSDAVFRFDNENYEWRLETARLETARRGGVAIAVPDQMVNCN